MPKKVFNTDFSFLLPGVKSAQDGLEIEIPEVMFPVRSNRPLTEEERGVVVKTFLGLIKRSLPDVEVTFKGVGTRKKGGAVLDNLPGSQLPLFPQLVARKSK